MQIKKTPKESPNADTVDGYHAGDLLKKNDDTMTGKLGLSTDPATGDSITTSNGSDSKGHMGTTGTANGALSIDTNISVAGSADLIDVPALPSWKMVLDSEVDSFSVGRAPAGTVSWVDAIELDASGNTSSATGLFGTRSATLTVASSTASAASRDGADYVCDGTNDEAEINAALNALAATGSPGTVQLSEGSFYVGAAVSMPANMVLLGHGMNVTIITKKSGAGNFSMIVNAGGANNLTVKNLTLDPNRAGNSSDSRPIQFTSVSRPLIDGVEVRNMANDGMGFTGCTQVIVRNCSVHDGSVSGIDTFATCNYVVVKDCRVYNIVSSGIYISGANYASVTGNIVDKCGVDGICVPSNSNYVSVTGNIVRGCGTYGIELNSPYSTASGNIGTSNTNHDIMTQNNYNTVAGNIAAGGSNYGVCSNCSGGTAVNATGNLIYNKGNDGLVFFGTNNSAITGNAILNSAAHGMYSGSTSSHSVVAGNLIAESSKAANNTYDNIVLYSAGNNHLVAGNKCYRGASGNLPLYDLYIDGTSTNNTVLMNDLTPATGGATFPWLSGYTYRKSHTLVPGKVNGWWVRWWTDSTPNTIGDGTLVEDSNWNTVNVTNYRSSGTNINARAECTFVAPYAEAFTFYCSSDDGIRFYWDGSLVTFAEGDGWKDQGDTTYSWTSPTLTVGAEHDIVVEHYQGGGGEHFHVEVQSASLTRRDLSGTNVYSKHYSPSTLANIPIRFAVSNATTTSYPGWWVRWWYRGSGQQTTFDYNANRAAEGRWANINVTDYNPGGYSDYYNMRGETLFIVPTTGAYTFTVISDDGVRFSIDGGATWVINQWGSLGTFSWTSGTLTAGAQYSLVVEHYETSGGQRLAVQFSGPGIAQQDLTSSWCYATNYIPTAGGQQVLTSGHSANSLNDVRFTNANGDVLNQWVESNDGTDAVIWVNIDSIAAPPTNTTIYMFYGNAGAGASSTTAIFDWFTHWDSDPGGWSCTGDDPNHFVSISGTELHFYGNFYDCNYTSPGTVVFSYNKKCIVRVKRASNTEVLAGFGTEGGHKACMRLDSGGTVAGRTNNGGDSDTSTFATDNGSYHTYEIRRRGTLSVEFVRDGVSMATTTTQVPADTNLNLWFRNGNNQYGSGYSDFIGVANTGSVEPTHGDWGTEATGTFYVYSAGAGTTYGFSNSASLNRTS